MKTVWSRDDRFEMVRGDFEIFHNYTERSVVTEYHTHNFYEVLFFLSGSVEYAVESRLYLLHPGDIILTNNSELHKTIIKDGKPYERYVLWIQPTFIETVNRQFPGVSLTACFDSTAKLHHNLVCPDQAVFQTFLHLLEKLSAPAGVDQPDLGILHACYMTELLVFLNRAQKATALTAGVHVLSNPKIDEVVFYINNHLHEPLSLDALSRRFYISKFYLSRLFKACTGIPLHQYILNKRFLHAKRLLLSGKDPYCACVESGFRDYSHFSRSFKAFFGYPPSGIPSP